MVQTRQAAKDEHKYTAPVGTNLPPTKREHATASRPLKRARKVYHDERAPSIVEAEPLKDLERNDTIIGPTKPPRKARQKKDQVVPRPTDFAPRVSSPWRVGAHVSAAGGVENAVVNAARVRANAFALFVKSQRKWSSPPLTDESVSSFKTRMNEFGYDPRHVLPHGSYLINLANPDTAKRDKSYECFLDDLQRCERLGLMFYNFHPGSTVGNATKEESISLIAQCLNKAHKETSSVITVIENMCGAKNIIGAQFTELAGIIEQVEDKSRVGVCLDTCHLYAAGYDISTKVGWDETISLESQISSESESRMLMTWEVATFDRQVGLSYLKGMHLNDSKTPLGSRKDRHENIGLGTLKLPTFLAILSDPRVQNIPLILETPTFEAVEVWECEIKVLNALSEVGACPDINVMLKNMVGDIQNVIREYHDHKEMAGKKGTSAVSKAKEKTRKRKTRGTEEDQATSSDGESSCAERSE